MIRRPPRSTRKESSAASDVYKRQPIIIARDVRNDLTALVLIENIADVNDSFNSISI